MTNLDEHSNTQNFADPCFHLTHLDEAVGHGAAFDASPINDASSDDEEKKGYGEEHIERTKETLPTLN